METNLQIRPNLSTLNSWARPASCMPTQRMGWQEQEMWTFAFIAWCGFSNKQIYKVHFWIDVYEAEVAPLYFICIYLPWKRGNLYGFPGGL